jgi:hypothetical protein
MDSKGGMAARKVHDSDKGLAKEATTGGDAESTQGNLSSRNARTVRVGMWCRRALLVAITLQLGVGLLLETLHGILLWENPATDTFIAVLVSSIMYDMYHVLHVRPTAKMIRLSAPPVGLLYICVVKWCFLEVD